NWHLWLRLQLAAAPIPVRKQQGHLQQFQPSIHGEAELSAQEGIGSEERRVWSLLRVRGSRRAVRLSERERPAINRCGRLGSRRHRRYRVSWTSNLAGNYRLQDRQVDR